MNPNELRNRALGEFIGAPGHHKYFLTSQTARKNLYDFSCYIRAQGIAAFLEREYPAGDIKKIIINRIDDNLCVVDGNKHLAALLLVNPALTLGELLLYRPDILRFWEKGIEHGQNPGRPYDIYIPGHIDTKAFPSVRTGYDYFKTPPELIQIIPADIPFDSPLFPSEDRGKALCQTVVELSKLYSDLIVPQITR